MAYNASRGTAGVNEQNAAPALMGSNLANFGQGPRVEGSATVFLKML
jgi:hypothetical protein